MALKRPLVKRVDGDWHMGIIEMPGVRGFMFQWTFGEEEEGRVQSIYPADLTAWPVLGMMLLATRDRLLESESLEEALSEIDRLGWGEPPHIDEVFMDTRNVFQLLGSVLTGYTLKKEERDVTMEGALQELREKWQTFVDSVP